MFLLQVLSHLILSHRCHFHDELILHSCDVPKGIILHRVVGEGLFEEVAFEKVLRSRQCLQKCILDREDEHVPELDVGFCLSRLEGRAMGTEQQHTRSESKPG